MDVDAVLDPETAVALAALPSMARVDGDLVPKIRHVEAKQAAAVVPSDAVDHTDHAIPGPAGAPDVTVRVHRPKGVEGALPGLYWIHGGGMVVGNMALETPRLDRWCTDLGCVAVSVEYRLAPETPYPGPLEDCYAGLAWMHAHADELGVDRSRLGIGGPSAGGGLAAGLGLLARDRGELPVAFQLLIYPMIDDRMTSVSSTWEVPVWSPVANRYGWASYLGGLAGDDVPIYAAPARATDLTGLPPTFIPVGALDGFLDEDVDFGMRLTHSGVATELKVYPGAPHGFDILSPGTALARRAHADIAAWLERAMAPTA